MKRSDVYAATVADLVSRFADVCVMQNRALVDDDIARFNHLYDQMAAIRDELKRRPGDQRSALRVLFDHRDLQVRLQAARAAFPVAPIEARRVVQAIADSRQYPQAGDAGMCLWALDEGIFVPD